MPGLHLYTSNRLEILQLKMAATFREHPLPPLQKEIVVVQSRGMERWLNLEIARQNGICAHVAYLFPKAFVYQLFRQVADLPETAPFDPDINTWRILNYLPSLLTRPGTKNLANYVQADRTGLKTYQLARKIAETFDRYTIMRPDLITAWDKARNPLQTASSESRWQAAFWQMLLEADGQTDVPRHAAALRKLFLETPLPALDLPARISIFGISTLPPFYLDILRKTAEQVDVNMYYLNPCREYWEYAYSPKQISRYTEKGLSEDDAYYDCGNPLLGSMGGAGREFFSLVLNSIGDTGEDLFKDPGDATLLAAVQSDILNLRKRNREEGPPVPDGDTSIRIHACHSRFREVEVLYDQLLDLFAHDRNLHPTDIIVMMPDVTAYAPLIQAVFAPGQHESPQIPYSIADTYIRSSNTLADTFLRILALDQQRLRAPAVLDILESPAVRKRFGIEEQGLVRIKKWVAETGICWGRDKTYREDLGLPGFHANTWQFGLERMLLGYALPPDDEGSLFTGILPYGDIEGDDARLLGAFTDFAQTLFDRVGALNRSRPLTQWAAQLDAILTTFFAQDETTVADLSQIRDTLNDAGLAGYAAATNFQEPVSLEVIRTYLETRIGREPLSFGFISSGVTFCTLLPMRSIPFKVVCMLGLNDGDFPRSGPVPGFDLTAGKRQLCDWSKRHEDRYLFLESLLSARQHLILSYIGCDPQDNSVRPPSVLVSELLDYITAGFKTAGKDDLQDGLVIRHPLHPFSPRYFQADSGLISYSQADCHAARASLATRRLPAGFPESPLPPPSPQPWARVQLGQFCRFFNNPTEFLVKNRLQVNFTPWVSDLPEEREPIELDALQAYPIKHDLVAAGLTAGNPNLIRQALLASGKLPPGQAGKLALKRLQQDADQFIERIRDFSRAQPAKPLEIEITCGSAPPITLQGRLCNLYPEGQMFYRCARLKAKDLLSAWIHHLLFCLEDNGTRPETTTVISSRDRITLQTLPADNARAELDSLAGLFTAGLQHPLCFFAETSYAFAAARLTSGKTVSAALQAARKEWHSSPHHTGEGENSYLRRRFGLEMPTGQEFQETALSIFRPLLAAIPAPTGTRGTA